MASVHVCILQTSFAKRDDTVAFLKEQVPWGAGGIHHRQHPSGRGSRQRRSHSGGHRPDDSLCKSRRNFRRRPDRQFLLYGRRGVRHLCEGGRHSRHEGRSSHGAGSGPARDKDRADCHSGNHPRTQSAPDRKDRRRAGKTDGMHLVPPESRLGRSSGRTPGGA